MPQAGALLAAATLAGYHHLITADGTGMGAALAAGPMLAVGLGLGMIGAPLADLTLGKVPHQHAGSASGLFNTGTQLGIALGTALTALVLFTTSAPTPAARPWPPPSRTSSGTSSARSSRCGR
ncbi:hypothetical protein ACH427_31885 [Streptomyces sp. NPDC020379]|uniref:hypothetical protein n=1 Tax=Streptomyces sp. NPDC020379 TaxID=3365071 RepID=UPI00379D037E